MMKEYKLTTKDFMSFYNSRLSEMCKKCPSYGKIYSCPPLASDFFVKINNSEAVYVIIDSARDLQERNRKQLEMDAFLSERYDMVFSCGKCTKCHTCMRTRGQPCNEFLYSACVLNIDLGAVFQYLTGEKLGVNTFYLIYVAL